MFKKLCFLLVFVLFFVSLLAIPVLAEESLIKINFNGKLLKFEVAPIVRDGNLMVELREIGEQIGASLEWDGANQVVSIAKNYTTINLQVNNSIGYVNKKMILLKIAPIIKNDRVLVPLSFFADNMDVKVEFDQKNRIVNLKEVKNTYYK